MWFFSYKSNEILDFDISMYPLILHHRLTSCTTSRKHEISKHIKYHLFIYYDDVEYICSAYPLRSSLIINCFSTSRTSAKCKHIPASDSALYTAVFLTLHNQSDFTLSKHAKAINLSAADIHIYRMVPRHACRFKVFVSSFHFICSKFTYNYFSLLNIGALFGWIYRVSVYMYFRWFACCFTYVVHYGHISSLLVVFLSAMQQAT